MLRYQPRYVCGDDAGGLRPTQVSSLMFEILNGHMLGICCVTNPDMFVEMMLVDCDPAGERF
jgi:hypothetical protein